MLVLGRKSKESIVILPAGDPHHAIRVTVIGVKGGGVRLGIDADQDVAIYREEVWARVRTERAIATASESD